MPKTFEIADMDCFSRTDPVRENNFTNFYRLPTPLFDEHGIIVSYQACLKDGNLSDGFVGYQAKPENEVAVSILEGKCGAELLDNLTDFNGFYTMPSMQEHGGNARHSWLSVTLPKEVRFAPIVFNALNYEKNNAVRGLTHFSIGTARYHLMLRRSTNLSMDHFNMVGEILLAVEVLSATKIVRYDRSEEDQLWEGQKNIALILSVEV